MKTENANEDATVKDSETAELLPPTWHVKWNLLEAELAEAKRYEQELEEKLLQVNEGTHRVSFSNPGFSTTTQTFSDSQELASHVPKPRNADDGLFSRRASSVSANSDPNASASSGFLEQKELIANRGPSRTSFIDHSGLGSEGGSFNREPSSLQEAIVQEANAGHGARASERVIDGEDLRLSNTTVYAGVENLSSTHDHVEGGLMYLQSEPTLSMEPPSRTEISPQGNPVVEDTTRAISLVVDSAPQDFCVEVMESTLTVPLVTSNEKEDPQLVANPIDDDDEPAVAFLVNMTRRHQIIVFGAFVLAIIVATVSGVTARYTRPGGKPLTPSPTSSHEPSTSPSLFPSMSPSTSLFGFVAAHSFDSGNASSIQGTAQQKALAWLEKSGVSTFNYQLLQNYVLATLYYATFGNQWISTASYERQRFSGNIEGVDLSEDWLADSSTDVCKWFGVFCNNRGEITSLHLTRNHLIGSIPMELAILGPSLSKILHPSFFLRDISSNILVLAFVVSLDLSDNAVVGSVPSSFGNLSSLGM